MVRRGGTTARLSRIISKISPIGCSEERIGRSRCVGCTSTRTTGGKDRSEFRCWKTNSSSARPSTRTRTEEGTPQGGSASPLLANVYLHYVFDLWAQAWRRKQVDGDMIIVRFADGTPVQTSN